MKNYQSVMDKLAITFSLICAIHCLVLPIVLAVFPLLSALSCEEGFFHQTMLYFVIPTSCISLVMGCWKHKNMLVLLCGVSGLIILTFAALYGHELLGCNGERIESVIGSVMIAIGHINNYRLCRKHDCSEI